MDVRIDAARDHDLSGSVNDPSAADLREASRRADRDDLASSYADVGGFRAAR